MRNIPRRKWLWGTGSGVVVVAVAIAMITGLSASASSSLTKDQAIASAQAALSQAQSLLSQAANAPEPTATVTVTATPDETPTPTPTITPVTGNDFRLFAATSLWNKQKSGVSYSAAGDSALHGATYGVNDSQYDHPLYYAKSSDPLTTFKLGAGWGHPATTITSNAPAGMVPSSGTDGALDVVLTDGRLLDIYGASVSGNTVTGSFYGISDAVNGSGFGTSGTGGATGTTAIGAPQAAGTILARDITAGVIDHAVDIGMPSAMCGGKGSSGANYVAPAIAGDCSQGPIPEGGLLLIPAGTNMPSGLDANGQLLFAALQKYGAYVTDQVGGNWPVFFGDNSSTVQSAFKDADWTKLGQLLRLADTWDGSSASPTPSVTPTPTVTPITTPTGLWTPTPGVAWQWEISSDLTSSEISEPVQAFDIDGFDNTSNTVSQIHAAGKHAICYIDVGTAENWRSDYSSFPKADLGKSNSWAGENWLNITDPNLKPVIAARIQMCASKGFDAVEPDNMDGSENTTGFSISNAQQDAYDEWVAQTVHAAGMSVAQKNFEDQSKTLQPSFDFVIEEQCIQYSDCTDLAPYVSAGKAVLDVEYNYGTSTTWCSKLPAGMQGMDKKLALDDTYTNCPAVKAFS